MARRNTTRRATRSRGRSAALTGLIVAGVVACGDVLAPVGRFDPDLMLDRLDEVLFPLDAGGDFLPALDLAVATLEFYGGTFLAEAVSPRPERREGLIRSLRTARRAGEVRSGVSQGKSQATEATPEPASSAFRIPFGLAGETLEWDRREGYVISGRAGAPSHGVRFLLYRMDRQTGYPATPLSRIGHLDITDEDGRQAEALRVRAVRTAGPDRVLADYRVTLTGSGTYDEGWLQITTRGAVGDGAVVELDLSQQFAWSWSADRDELRLDYRYGRGSRSVALGGRAESRFDALDWETFDFGVSFRGARPATDIEADIAQDGSLRGEIRSDGRAVVRIGGYDGRPRFQRVDGGGMTVSDEVTLERIWTGITDLIRSTDRVMIPADLLIASG